MEYRVGQVVAGLARPRAPRLIHVDRALLVAVLVGAAVAHRIERAVGALGQDRRVAQQVRAAAAAGVRMMPIGVPKVAYRVPGSSQADWVSLIRQWLRKCHG